MYVGVQRKETEMKIEYDLKPTDSRKSFYGKATVIETATTKQLYSYGTLIMSCSSDGVYKRHWDGWSATTGRHITAFCGMHKKEFMALPLVL